MDCPKCGDYALDNASSEDEEYLNIDRTCDECGFKFTVYFKAIKWEEGHHEQGPEIQFDFK